MDTFSSEIHKVLTHKSGQFVFSRRFDHLAATRSLDLFQARHAVLASLPMPPHWAREMGQARLRHAIHSTAAIEGNPLTAQDVAHLLDGPASPVPATEAEQEILNLQAACARFLPGKRTLPTPIDEAWVRDIHAAVMQGLGRVSPGRYRNEPVQVGNAAHGGVYTPPKILDDVKTLMAALVGWSNGPDVLALDPLLRAALIHYHLAAIHPFFDGNGRTARLVEAALISSAGYPAVASALWSFYHVHVHDYYKVFRQTQKTAAHSVQPFVDFFLQGLSAALDDIQDGYDDLLRKELTGSYAAQKRKSGEISKRQEDLVALLLETPSTVDAAKLKTELPFRLLYQNRSEKTIQRDLIHLTQQGFLSRQGRRYELRRDLLLQGSLPADSAPTDPTAR